MGSLEEERKHTKRSIQNEKPSPLAGLSTSAGTHDMVYVVME